MARKNLARTAIEGGRRKYCRHEEHEGTCSERRSVRDLLRKICVEPDLSEDVSFEPRWAPYDKEFADKLHPVRRWMEAQIGRFWDDIYADIKTRFDSRTTAGRHILYDHLLPMVGRWSDYNADRHDLTICHDGVLRRGPYRRFRYRRDRPVEPPRLYKQPTPKQLAKFFAGGRRVDENRMAWFVPTRPRWSEWRRCDGGKFCRHPDWQHRKERMEISYLKNGVSFLITHLKVYYFYRQDHDLTEREIAFWRTLTWDTRSQYLYKEDEYERARKKQDYVF